MKNSHVGAVPGIKAYAVPQSLRDGSYGLGATKAETVLRVVLPAALPGIVSAVVLAITPPTLTAIPAFW